jgi:predicted alpha/beta-fold hydrolase
MPRVKDVKVPTLVVHSKDDPVVSFQCCPVSECVANPNFIVNTTRLGGHVCYSQGVTGTDRWYPKVTHEYLEATLATLQEEMKIV